MTDQEQIALRLPAELLDQADRLVDSIAADPELSSFGRVTRAAVLRLAVHRGLAQLERKYRPSKKRR